LIAGHAIVAGNPNNSGLSDEPGASKGFELYLRGLQANKEAVAKSPEIKINEERCLNIVSLNQDAKIVSCKQRTRRWVFGVTER
jgi:hypothetical protein